MDDFNKTPNIYPNLNAIPSNAIPANVIPSNANISNEQQFRLKKLMKLDIIF